MIAIGNDHAAVELKNDIVSFFKENGIEYKDFGCGEGEKCQYPDMAKTVCSSVVSGEAEMAVLVCGTGVGMSISANKIRGIRAACVSDCFSAKYTRLHNDANVLCIGARVVGSGLARELVKTFIETGFEGGRHAERVELIKKLEEEF